MTSFNAFGWESFFFGHLDRKEAERLLANCDIGTFLIRESTSTNGCYSLCVKVSDGQFHNYLIEKYEDQATSKSHFKISTQTFEDMPSLLNHFKMNNLTLEPGPVKLQRPLEKGCLERVKAKFRFDAERITDLSFERGEILEILGKPEVGWWLARNCLGEVGMIPSNRVKLNECDELSLMNPSTNSSIGSADKRSSENSTSNEQQKRLSDGIAGSERAIVDAGKIQPLQENSWVEVKVNRLPSIYDIEALTLKKGRLLYLQKILPNGMCRGIDESGRTGLFPITYVEPVRQLRTEETPWHSKES